MFYLCVIVVYFYAKCDIIHLTGGVMAQIQRTFYWKPESDCLPVGTVYTVHVWKNWPLLWYDMSTVYHTRCICMYILYIGDMMERLYTS